MMDYVRFLRTIRQQGVVAVFSDDELLTRVVLKGGNALDLVYQISVRTSLDLDFSLDGQFDDLDRIRQRLERALTRTFADLDLHVFDFRIREEPKNLTSDLADFWGGYKAEFKLIENAKRRAISDDIDSLRRNAIGVGKRNSTVFSIEISKHEYCAGKVPHEIEGYRIYAYSPEMMVAEKLRAICQQMPAYAKQVRLHPRDRARDFVDIHVLTEHFEIDFGSDLFHSLIRDVFATKRVPLELIDRIGESAEFHREGFQSVKDTVLPNTRLQDFEFYRDNLTQRCELLKSLWHE